MLQGIDLCSAYQGLHQIWVQLTEAGGDKGAKGVAHNTGLLEALMPYNGSHSVRSMVHLSSPQAQTHGHMPELQHYHGVGSSCGKQHPHEVYVRRLQHTHNWTVMHDHWHLVKKRQPAEGIWQSNSFSTMKADKAPIKNTAFASILIHKAEIWATLAVDI